MPDRPLASLTLSSRASYRVAAIVCVLVMWTSAAPIVSYPLYNRQWGLTQIETATIFAVYPATLLIVLVLFGNLSDHVGRRRAMLLGMGASFAGAVLFALGDNVYWLYIGRGFMGVGVALALGAATAALVDYSDPGKADRAGAVTTNAMAIGLALPALIGGALIEFGPNPLHLNFWVFGGAVALTACLVWLMPRSVLNPPDERWRPARLAVPPGRGRQFLLACVGSIGGYSISVLLQSLGAQMAVDLIRTDNALVAGAVIALNAVAIVIGTAVSTSWSLKRMIRLGALAAIIGGVLMVVAGSANSLSVFFVAAVFGGAGYAWLFTGGITTLTESSLPQHRAAALSLMYVFTYLSQATIALTLGGAATLKGMAVAVEVAAGIILALGVAAFALSRYAPVRGPGL